MTSDLDAARAPGHPSGYQIGQRETRPWGSFQVLAVCNGIVVKQIEVLQSHTLSLQRHQHRAEHWVVISGLARATLDEALINLRVGETVFIPKMVKHRIESVGTEALLAVA